MFEIICVTNRKLCRESFLTRLARVAEARPAAIILREKDLPPSAYRVLAADALAICEARGVPLIVNKYAEEAIALGAPGLHMPLPFLRTMPPWTKASFARLGTSVHRPEEVAEAVSYGANYVIAGHIYDTDCEKGVPGRGTVFLKQTLAAARQKARALGLPGAFPVYGIGGITAGNICEIRAAGAAGACVMTGFMTCPDPVAYMAELKGALGI